MQEFLSYENNNINNDLKNVAIIGWWDGPNYGSKLVYYAINRTIQNFGYNVAMIWPPHVEDYKLSQFARKNYNITKHLSIKNLYQLNNFFDSFIVGSDQYWNYSLDYYSGFRMLDFVWDCKNKISCATSFGHDTLFFPKHREKEAGFLLKRFNGISVREHSAQYLLRKYFNVDSVLLIDPTFFLNYQDYSLLANESTLEIGDNDYILVYYLDPDENKKNFVKQISKNMNLPLKTIVDIQGRLRKTEFMADCGAFPNIPSVQSFIKLYQNAKYVITDSFHGTAFAVNFNKPFYTIVNARRGKTRFKLYENLGLVHRLIDDLEKFDINNINFDIDFYPTNTIIENNRTFALEWLKECLSRNSNNQLSDFDIFKMSL